MSSMIACMLALAAAIATAAPGQAPPDFSGHWVLVNGGTASATTPVELTIRELLSKRGPELPTVIIERRSHAGIQNESFEVGLTGVAWKGSTLQIAKGEHEEVWALDRQGRLVIVVSDRSPAGKPTKATLTFLRKPVRVDL